MVLIHIIYINGLITLQLFKKPLTLFEYICIESKGISVISNVVLLDRLVATLKRFSENANP